MTSTEDKRVIIANSMMIRWLAASSVETGQP
jgi:hypothetical protein